MSLTSQAGVVILNPVSFLFLQQMHYDMEDLIEQANEVQESMSRTYGVPDEVDEADLEAGEPTLVVSRMIPRLD